MILDKCYTSVFQKLCLPALRRCRWLTFHRHCVYSARLTPWMSCSSLRKQHHDSAASVLFNQKLQHRSLVRVCGTDVLGFLQGLVTNDVRMLETDVSVMYAMMLNVQASIVCVHMCAYGCLH